MTADVTAFYDPATASVTYVLADPATRACAVIDSVLGFDPGTGRTDRSGLARVIAHIERRALRLRWILETHVHADHLSGAFELKNALGGQIAIGTGVIGVAHCWAPLLAAPNREAAPALDFDRLLCDGETIMLGDLQIRVMGTPGHTPACVTYVAADAAFVGDTLFMPVAGTARCDFPGGSALQLYRSIRRILELPPQTRIFTGHDYGPARGEAPSWESSVQAQRDSNAHVAAGVSEARFVELRTARDRTLMPPALLFPALQVNLRAGRLPAKDANGVSYLKLPLDLRLDELRRAPVEFIDHSERY